jgi:hypothetical protein
VAKAVQEWIAAVGAKTAYIERSSPWEKHRELQCPLSRRAAQRRDFLHFTRGADRHRELATPLQHDQAARLNRIQATSTRGVRARIRRVAGCAPPTGSAAHAGETANLKLTFHLDHSAGADQPGRADQLALQANQSAHHRARAQR